MSAVAPLVIHPYGAPLLKRLVQAHPEFASALFDTMRGELTRWATAGGGWVILALLECSTTHAEVLSEVVISAKEIAGADAAGCRSLSAAIESAAPTAKAAPRKGKPAQGKAKRARGAK